MVLMDSNGRGVTPDTVKVHIREEEKEKWEIQVAQVFTLKEAWDGLRKGNMRVDGARVVVDCIMNDVRSRGGDGEVEECDWGGGRGGGDSCV